MTPQTGLAASGQSQPVGEVQKQARNFAGSDQFKSLKQTEFVRPCCDVLKNLQDLASKISYIKNSGAHADPDIVMTVNERLSKLSHDPLPNLTGDEHALWTNEVYQIISTVKGEPSIFKIQESNVAELISRFSLQLNPAMRLALSEVETRSTISAGGLSVKVAVEPLLQSQLVTQIQPTEIAQKVSQTGANDRITQNEQHTLAAKSPSISSPPDEKSLNESKISYINPDSKIRNEVQRDKRTDLKEAPAITRNNFSDPAETQALRSHTAPQVITQNGNSLPVGVTVSQSPTSATQSASKDTPSTPTSSWLSSEPQRTGTSSNSPSPQQAGILRSTINDSTQAVVTTTNNYQTDPVITLSTLNSIPKSQTSISQSTNYSSTQLSTNRPAQIQTSTSIYQVTENRNSTKPSLTPHNPRVQEPFVSRDSTITRVSRPSYTPHTNKNTLTRRVAQLGVRPEVTRGLTRQFREVLNPRTQSIGLTRQNARTPSPTEQNSGRQLLRRDALSLKNRIHENRNNRSTRERANTLAILKRVSSTLNQQRDKIFPSRTKINLEPFIGSKVKSFSLQLQKALAISEMGTKLLQTFAKFPLKDLQNLLNLKISKNQSNGNISHRERLALREVASYLKHLRTILAHLLSPQSNLNKRLSSELSISELELLIGLLVGNKARKGVKKKLVRDGVTDGSPVDIISELIASLEGSASTGERAHESEINSFDSEPGSESELTNENSTTEDAMLTADGTTPKATLTTVLVKEEQSGSSL